MSRVREVEVRGNIVKAYTNLTGDSMKSRTGVKIKYILNCSNVQIAHILRKDIKSIQWCFSEIKMFCLRDSF